MGNACIAALLLGVVTAGSALAQTPTGAIAGTVSDASGGTLAGVSVQIVNRENGLARTVTTSSAGGYGAAALPSGAYLISAEANGFKRVERPASVEAGTTTTVHLALELGDVSEALTVSGAVPLLRHDDHQVGSVIRRDQIESLPLNGRNFLDLASLEPGVTSPIRSTNNRVLLASLGSGLQTVPRVGHTRVTVDGANIGFISSIGAALQVSQDVVQEFQVSTINFDPSTGLTSNGAINIVTRSGGNDVHGSGFFIYRDHHLAAYPGLTRDPSNPDPFFRRSQFGASAGGPIRRSRAFFFVSAERNDQRGVVSINPGGDLAGLGGIFPSPYVGRQFSARADLRLSEHHQAVWRYTDDRNRTFAPANERIDLLPSGWSRRTNDVYQNLISLASVLSSNLVSDLRFSSFHMDSPETPAGAEDCPVPCVGLGSARIIISDGGITLGKSRSLEFTGRRHQLGENVTWQRGTHTLRFGFDWEHGTGTSSNLDRDPAILTLWDPARVRQLDPTIPLPGAFNRLEDILQLPVQSFLTAVGPADELHRDFRPYRVFDLYRFHIGDTWRVRSRLTVNSGLGWSYEPNALNHDLTKPALLIALAGTEGLAPPAVQRDRFSPTIGFAWTATRDERTVVRGGAGRYFDPMNSTNSSALANERLYLSPLGAGRLNFSGANIPCNGLTANTQQPPSLTGAQLLSCLPAIRTELGTGLDSNNRDFSVRNINRTKTATNLHDSSFETPSAIHASLGVQRQLAPDLVVGADVVWRWFAHTFLGGIDYNRFISRQGAQAPARAVIPPCTEAQRLDDTAVCSNGPMAFDTTMGRQRYAGLLMRADKRLSGGSQFRVSYALGSYVGTNGTAPGAGFNNDDWLENYGPMPTDLRHVLNVSGAVDLPLRFQLAFNVSAQSRPPLSVYVSQADFNGDGTRDDLLPGTRVNEFGRGLDADDLVRLVDQYNQQHPLAPLALQDGFSLGDNFFTQDLRLTHLLRGGREGLRLQVFCEVFNLLNTANLVQYENNIVNEDFGRPGARFTQVFGSGGPRAVQIGARMSF